MPAFVETFARRLGRVYGLKSEGLKTWPFAL